MGDIFFSTSLRWHCASTFGPEEGITHTATITEGLKKGQTTLVTSGVFVHPVWSIEWQESDLPFLSPPPPTFTPPNTWFELPSTSTTRYVERTTTPVSTTVTPISTAISSFAASPTPGNSRSDRSDPNIYMFLIVGLPVIICVGIIFGIWWCCHTKRNQRREEAHLAAHGIALQQAQPASLPQPQTHDPAPLYEPPPPYKERGNDS